MAGPIWRFFAFDIRTRLPTVELPVIDGSLTFGDVLNAPGSAKFSLPLNPPDPVSVTTGIVAAPYAGFAVEASGVLRWAGPILTHSYNIQNGTVDFACEGIWSYVRRRTSRFFHIFNAASAIFANGWVPAVDNGVGWRDCNIARHLLDRMREPTGGDLGIDIGDPLAIGSFSELILPDYERRGVGEIIEQLAARENGFDFRLDPEWSGGPNSEITWKWRPSSPPIGRRTELVFDQSNSEITGVTLDSTNVAYTVHETGQGTGEAQPVAVAVDQALIDANFLIETSESASNVLEQDTLFRHALRRLARGRVPVITPKVDVPIDLLGSFIAGDQVMVRIDLGLLDVDEWYRVTAFEVDPGAGLIHVTLAPSVLFAT